MTGWFVQNVADAPAIRHARGGVWAVFETEEAPFPQLGINVHVLEPGQPCAAYHAENQQEDFLVLAGEALAIVEGEERALRQWDLLHCPPWTSHVIVGAGEGPCALLKVGARIGGEQFRYPVEPLAARFGASAVEETTVPGEAYGRAGWEPVFEPTRLPWPPPGAAA